MISAKCFSDEHIRRKARELRANDPLLLEKSIHALALLGHLVDSGLPFIFKGGTSVMLLLDPIRRLSIDIDIQCGAARREVDAVLDSIATKPPFIRMEPDDRGDRGLPRRRHFFFYFRSIETQQPHQYIQLDIVEEDRCPIPVQRRVIRTPLIDVEREVYVTIPTPEGLLADKLTAFAPRTIGVRLRHADGSPGRVMQVAKQLFDLGELFTVCQDIRAIQQGYDAVAALEMEYRQPASSTREGALQDTLRACEEIALPGLRGAPRFADTELLLDGIGRLKNHLVGARFDPAVARIAAGKTALLAACLLDARAAVDLEQVRYRGDAADLERLRGVTMTHEPWRCLNRLIAVNPEAFHYWHVAQRFMSPIAKSSTLSAQS